MSLTTSKLIKDRKMGLYKDDDSDAVGGSRRWREENEDGNYSDIP